MLISDESVDAANSLTPSILGLAKGKPNAGKTATHARLYDNARARNILGIEFRGIPETTKDMMDYYLSKGWVSTT